MNRILLLTILSFISQHCFGENLTSELIPNSELQVSFPSNWNFSKPYIGNGKYSSISVYLPKDEHGGYPGHPEFEFEFIEPESLTEEKLKAIKDIPDSIKLGGVESKVYTDKPEVSYLHSDMSHSYSTLQLTSFLIPMHQGYLICSLSTEAGKETKHKKYVGTLKKFCVSAIHSAKSPNKALHGTNP